MVLPTKNQFGGKYDGLGCENIIFMIGNLVGTTTKGKMNNNDTIANTFFSNSRLIILVKQQREITNNINNKN